MQFKLEQENKRLLEKVAKGEEEEKSMDEKEQNEKQLQVIAEACVHT